MRIGLYGLPTAGKSHILSVIDFLEVKEGSKLLKQLEPSFDSLSDEGKKNVRQNFAESLQTHDSFIMDGHYAFGQNIAFTEKDGQLYDAVMYLYISPEIIKNRMMVSERNRKYLGNDIESWQKWEIESLREYCHSNDKDFYVIDNPPGNSFDDVAEVVEFIRSVANGFSCESFASKCADDILSSCKSDTIVLIDGDKTITTEDTSSAVFGYRTHIYDGNFYTGYQSWRQYKEFNSYNFDDLKEIPVPLNEKVINEITNNTYILTSGHVRVWSFISECLCIPFYCGDEMSADTKYYITKKLQAAGKKVIAYGDGMNDYYMLIQADEGFLVTKNDGSISRSLLQRRIEGLTRV